VSYPIHLSRTERLSTLAGVTPHVRPEFEALVEEAKARGMRPFIVSVLRSCEEQKGTASKARGCRSWHLLGRAVDLQLQSNRGRIDDREPYEELGRWWESHGGVWGGDWETTYPRGIPGYEAAGPGDVVHFQWTPEYTARVPDSVCDDSDCQGSVNRFWEEDSGRAPSTTIARTAPSPLSRPVSRRVRGASLAPLVMTGLVIAGAVMLLKGK